MGLAIMIPDISFADVKLGKVTMSEDIKLKGLEIIGDSVVSGITTTYRVRYVPLTTNHRNVVWSIEEGGEYAEIKADTGHLTIKSGAVNNKVVIKVTSDENLKIFDTKEITVTYNSEGVKEIAYIATEGGNYVDLGVLGNDSYTIKTTCRMPSVETTNTEKDRQYIFCATGDYNITQSKKWNQFNINVNGNAWVYRHALIHDKLNIEFNNTMCKCTDVDTGRQLALESTSCSKKDQTQNYRLYCTYEEDKICKKTMIYSFDIYDKSTLVCGVNPVLKSGVPMFYERVTNTYLPIVDKGGSIWYSIEDNVDNEIKYK